jgi:tRNA threonylcarbamoyladenosine biosynthesis protein TsaB
MVDEAMRAAELSFAALDLVAVTVGPGAFTGIRIGLSAARGIALAAGKPSLGVTTFEAIAEEAGPVGAGERLLLSVDSRREDVLFLAAPPDSAIAIGPERITGWAPSGALVVAGERGEAIAALLPGRVADVRRVVPDAAAVARIAARRWLPGKPSAPPRPLYLREADTTLPKR